MNTVLKASPWKLTLVECLCRDWKENSKFRASVIIKEAFLFDLLSDKGLY